MAAAMNFLPVPYHFKIPHGLFLLEATSVAVDSDDNVLHDAPSHMKRHNLNTGVRLLQRKHACPRFRSGG